MQSVAVPVLCCFLLSAALPAREKPEKPGQARAQTQVQGAQGQFGAIYTMRDDFNLQFISAAYTLEPHRDYAATAPTADEKLLVIRFALKNARPLDNYYGGYTFTAVDEEENSYASTSGSTRYAPSGSSEYAPNLKPGQGVGQDSSKPLTVAIRIPNKARIKKLLVNNGRKAFPKEEILRFSIAGFADGDPKNTIAPLPAYAADASDKSGSTSLSLCQGTVGTFYPNTYVDVRCDSISYRPASDGKQTAVVQVTVKNRASRPVDSYYFQESPLELVEARDGSGQKYPPGEVGARQLSSDEALGSLQLNENEEASYRYFFEIPAGARLQSLRLGGGSLGHAYQIKF